MIDTLYKVFQIKLSKTADAQTDYLVRIRYFVRRNIRLSTCPKIHENIIVVNSKQHHIAPKID